MQTESANPLRVFLVEDSPAVLERLEAMLEDVSAREVGHANGAQEAIRRILAERPDLVVLDLRLADGSGFDVLRALTERAPDVEVLMLSNFASEPYRRMAERLGARGFYDKTTEFDGVRAALEARAGHLH
ncbi:MAG TPA: response regulator transcription factor [Burkholderiales bacterium]|nr:response regulator transcription factor [Burkholderiales bacterium]